MALLANVPVAQLIKIPYSLWNQNIHYTTDKNPPLILILSHTNPVHILAPYPFRSILHFSVIFGIYVNIFTRHHQKDLVQEECKATNTQIIK